MKVTVAGLELTAATSLRDALEGGLELNVRSRNCLKWNVLTKWPKITLGGLAKIHNNELLRIPNFGQRSLKELRSVLAEIGPAPPAEPPPTITIPVYPNIVLSWEPRTGVWQDQVGNSFNLWRIPR